MNEISNCTHNTVACLCTHCCKANAAMHSPPPVEFYVNVNNINILSVAQQCFMTNLCYWQ